jgi:hypothetical protein
MFVDAVEEADLVALFDGSQPVPDVLAAPDPPTTLAPEVAQLITTEGVTALVPTNAAIEAVPNWDDILDDEAALRHFVLAHVVPGALDEAEVFAAEQLTTLSNDVLQIDAATQTINGAHLVVVDQPGTNGIAHTVDAVLVVPALAPPPTTEPPTRASPTAASVPPTDPPAEPEPEPTPPATAPG